MHAYRHPVSVAIFLATACGSAEGDNAAARQACDDLATHVADAYQRCGHSADEGRAVVVKGVVCGSCSNVVDVRDEASLRSGCFAAVDGASCAVLLDATTPTPAACHEQLTLAPGACHAAP